MLRILRSSLDLLLLHSRLANMASEDVLLENCGKIYRDSYTPAGTDCESVQRIFCCGPSPTSLPASIAHDLFRIYAFPTGRFVRYTLSIHPGAPMLSNVHLCKII